MDTLKLLLELPLGTLAMLVGGYMGYRIAYVGRNLSHAAIDTLFGALAFGLIVRLTYSATETQVNPLGQAIFGVLTALAAAAIWRVWLNEAWFDFSRRVKLNDHDGHRSAWNSVLARGDGHQSVIAHLKDGTKLMSHGLPQWEKLPLGPCLLGEDGSVGLYVTDICGPDEGDWRSISGATTQTMTIVPASEIARLQVQWK